MLKGVRQLDGSASFSFLIDAEVFARSITSPLLQTTKLIAVSAQIGDLVVDSIHVKDGAISSRVAASSSGQSASVSIGVRTSGMVRVGFSRTGSGGQSFPNINTLTGNLSVYRNGALIFSAPASYAPIYDNREQIRANFLILMPTYLAILDNPGVGTHTYQVTDSNNVGIGGVFIEVEESK